MGGVCHVTLALIPPPQTLNEPGEDTSRFDTLMPATVTCPTQGGKVELGIVKQFTFASDLQVSERGRPGDQKAWGLEGMGTKRPGD